MKRGKRGKKVFVWIHRKYKCLSDVGEQVKNALVLFLTSSLAEDIPEAESFIASASDNCFAIGTERQIKNTIWMSSELSNLCQWRIFPNENLILWIAVSWDQFWWMLWPRQVANLWPSIDALHRLTGQSVPKANAPIGSSTAWHKQTMMMWRPSNCLNSCHMLSIRLHGWEWVLIPNVETIIISSTRQRLIV